MQPMLERILVSPESSFTCRSFDLTHFPFAWHVHPEIELTLITEGRGRRFVGDHIGQFEAGDLVLLGSQLPHTWYSQPGGGCRARSLVVQFQVDFLGEAFHASPEMRGIRQLLRRAERGLKLGGKAGHRIGQRLLAMEELSGMARLIALLEVLSQVASMRRVETLASRGFRDQLRVDGRGERGPLREDDRRRIDIACELMNRRFAEPIRQTQVARAVSMSPGAFSRFFRRSTGHSFSGYLHELRVGAACRLLIETDRPITAVCHESGFENLSNFNRVFRRLKGVTPREFRQAYAESD